MEAMNQDKTTLTHITHLHPLHIVEVSDTEWPHSCHACGFRCRDSSAIYGCTPCGYVMHGACARAAKTLRHAAHPDHQLSFRLAPPELQESEAYDRWCDACGCVINGHSYRCDSCNFVLHLPCARLPDAVTVDAHAHPLKLVYEERSDLPSLCICDVCTYGCRTGRWFYGCERCDFHAHVGCAVYVPEMLATFLYPRIDMGQVQNAAAENEAAESEADEGEAAESEADESEPAAAERTTAALLQQYQLMSLVSSAAYAKNAACISAGRSLADLA